MSNPTHTEQPNCNDDDETQNILPPQAHDLIEVEQDLIWEIDDCAAYKTTSECQRDGCTDQYRGIKVIGRKIESVQDYKTIAYQIYESYYDNPRTIPYRILQCLIDVPDPGKRNAIANTLSDAAKLGCTDANADQEKRTKKQLLDAVAPDNL